MSVRKSSLPLPTSSVNTAFGTCGNSILCLAGASRIRHSRSSHSLPEQCAATDGASARWRPMLSFAVTGARHGPRSFVHDDRQRSSEDFRLRRAAKLGRVPSVRSLIRPAGGRACACLLPSPARHGPQNVGGMALVDGVGLRIRLRFRASPGIRRPGVDRAKPPPKWSSWRQNCSQPASYPRRPLKKLALLIEQPRFDCTRVACDARLEKRNREARNRLERLLAGKVGAKEATGGQIMAFDR